MQGRGGVVGKLGVMINYQSLVFVCFLLFPPNCSFTLMGLEMKKIMILILIMVIYDDHPGHSLPRLRWGAGGGGE